MDWGRGLGFTKPVVHLPFFPSIITQHGLKTAQKLQVDNSIEFKKSSQFRLKEQEICKVYTQGLHAPKAVSEEAFLSNQVYDLNKTEQILIALFSFLPSYCGVWTTDAVIVSVQQNRINKAAAFWPEKQKRSPRKPGRQ